MFYRKVKNINLNGGRVYWRGMTDYINAPSGKFDDSDFKKSRLLRTLRRKKK
jgi:hypothetical protein